jgi:hypothetical protein
MRWITIPEPIPFINPATDEVAGTATFKEYIRALRADQRILQGLDHLAAFELSFSLTRAKDGEVVPIEDASWTVLAEVAKAPKTLSPAMIYAPLACNFVKAITEASSKKPE